MKRLGPGFGRFTKGFPLGFCLSVPFCIIGAAEVGGSSSGAGRFFEVSEEDGVGTRSVAGTGFVGEGIAGFESCNETLRVDAASACGVTSPDGRFGFAVFDSTLSTFLGDGRGLVAAFDVKNPTSVYRVGQTTLVMMVMFGYRRTSTRRERDLASCTMTRHVSSLLSKVAA